MILIEDEFWSNSRVRGREDVDPPFDKKYNLRRGINSYTPEVFFIAPEK